MPNTAMTNLNSTPNPAESPSLPQPDAIAALRAHPRFPEALRMMLHDIVGIYQGNRALNQVLNDRGRVIFGVLALYLHFSRDPRDPASGLTASRMKALCTETGLCSPGRAAAMLLLMRYAGYLAPAQTEGDRRLRLLVPTDRLIASQKERVCCQFRAMALLMPEGALGLANIDNEAFTATMARHFGSGFCAGFRILDSSPALYPLAERNAGMMILFTLLLATGEAGASNLPQPAAVSISALAQRFGVSRPHVLKLLRDAEVMNFVSRGGIDGDRILVLPQLSDALEEFGATLFLFLSQCVRLSLDESKG